MTLKTRKPTGRAGFPKILLEGGDKSGKSYQLAKLSASPKVGRTVVLSLGEDVTKWDEFGKLPGARFEIALHDGSWSAITAVIADAKAEAAEARAAGQPPFVLGLDTVSAMWDGLGDWARLRARSSKKNRALLAADPDAEIDVTPNYWNDRRSRWRQGVINPVLTFPGIVVMIARGGEVTLFENGQPVANRKSWSIEADKNLPFDASAHIRLSRDARPLLVSVASVHNAIRPGIDPPRRLPDDWSLESFIFDQLKLDAATTEVREFVEFQQELTPEEVREEVLNPDTPVERIQELYRYTQRAFPGVTLTGDNNVEELLLATITRAGKSRRAARQLEPGETPLQAAAAAGLRDPLTELGDWGLMIDEVTRPEDEEPAIARVDKAVEAGELDDVKAGAIKRAVKAKVAQVTQAAA